MGKLIYIYGTMGSAKTANALMRYFELKNRELGVLLLKPAIDDRDGVGIVKSRIGLEEKALTFTKEDNLRGLANVKGMSSIILDECQFCTEEQINLLKELSVRTNLTIYCYGLKTDFTSHLFEGSKRLLEIADEVKELEMTCAKCGARAEVNARVDLESNILKDGEQIEIGGNEKYVPLCYKCWSMKKFNKK